MNLKLLLPAILFIGVLMFASDVEAVACTEFLCTRGNVTADCTIDSSTFTAGTAYRSNTTVIYNVTSQSNATNLTSSLAVSALTVTGNLGTLVLHQEAEATSVNGTDFRFATSDLPDGNYVATATLYFDNVTNTAAGPNSNITLVEGNAISDFKVICTSRSFSVNQESGSGLPAVLGQQQAQQAESSQRNAMLIVVAIIAAVALFGMRKRR